jgi:hypothetical protein
MKIVSFYRLCDGVLIGQSYCGPDEHLQANTPDGCGAADGRHDHLCRRVDLATLNVVPWQPPAPPENDMQTYAWDDTSERWVSRPTLAAIAQDVRSERARRLAACDWVVARSMESGNQLPAAWLSYRQALRDVTLQPEFPGAVTWPDLPGA